MMRQMVAFVLLVFSAMAQTEPPAPLIFEGKPLRVPVACTEEDIQSLGLSCSADLPCAVYLELSGLEVLAGRMVVSGNLHTDSTAVASIVLASEDGGKTWVESHPRIRQAALDQMQFFDLVNGWISGQVIAALPRDPFFLVTIDGGKTWRQRPVFGDPHLGLIDRFHFTSATEGRVLVDRAQSGEGGRYALLESKTGGDSWSILQITTDRPTNVKFERTASAAWRLRANEATKAYQVEKREGQKWTMVAAFEVQAGTCAPAEIELKPPPEPPTPATATGEAASDAVEVFQIGGAKPKKPDAKKKKR
ncbi:MAG: WD40/YVTN/BNR-like repeat-containing protein [Bryobacteraceae bacterium]